MKVLVALALVLALATPARAHTLVPVASSPRIAVTCEPGLEDRARDLADGAEAALADIAADLPGLPVPGTIHVQVVAEAASIAAVAPPGHDAPQWAIGIAYPDLGIVTVALRRGAQLVDPAETLRHELAHIALASALGVRAPHWLHEGFAYQHSAEWSWDRAETLSGMAWFGGIVPIDELDRNFPAQELPANRAYAESYDFVGFLARRGRWEDRADEGDRYPFRSFLHALAGGENLDAAATRAYGRPLHALFDEWRDDLSRRYLTAPIGLIGLAVWIVCAALLILAWWRRRRHNRRRIMQWDREEAARQVRPTPYLAWPGDDPFAELDDDRPDDGPKLVN